MHTSTRTAARTIFSRKASCMLDEMTLLQVKDWYNQYVGTLPRTVHVDRRVRHVNDVRIELLDVANSLHLSRDDCYFAEAAALLHDIGQLEHYARHGAFMDERRYRPAALGVAVLRRSEALAAIDTATREALLCIVGSHSLAQPIRTPAPHLDLFSRLLRDADTLAGWRLATEYCLWGACARGAGPGPRLREERHVNELLTESLMRCHVAEMRYVKTLSERKLALMGRVFGLSFPRAYRIAKKRKYLEKIHETLPKFTTARLVYAAARAHLERCCAKCDCDVVIGV